MINLFIYLKWSVKTRLWSTAATVTLRVVSFCVNFSTLLFLSIFSVFTFFFGQNSDKLKTHCTGHWSPSLTASRWTWKLCVWTPICFVMSVKNVGGVRRRNVDKSEIKIFALSGDSYDNMLTQSLEIVTQIWMQDLWAGIFKLDTDPDH